jgi:hypothetical protein
MTLTLSGSSGIVNPQGNQQTPAIGIGTNTAGIYWPNAAIMGFTVNGAEAMRVDQQGNVLIGTTTNVTASKLTVRHFGSNPAALAIGDTNTASSSTGLYFYTTSVANISVGTGGVLTFNTQGGAQENMRISGSGLVGIGTNNPTSPLVVSATSTRNTPLMTIQSLGVFGGGSGYDVGLTINIGAYGSPTSALNIFAGGPSVFYVGTNGNVGISSSTPVVSLDLSQRTDALAMPSGNSAQRPAAPVAGMVRFNSQTGYPEWYSTAYGSWTNFNSGPTYTVQYLIVAGGGAGGTGTGGGGGAGGVLSGNTTVAIGTIYTVIVGAGAPTGSYNSASTGGNNSSALGYTALGGGAGGSIANGGTINAGGNGGSGGGAASYSTGTVAAGSGTNGQGFNGGTSTAQVGGGGGGGATAVGANNSTGTPSGGAGALYGISGVNYYYGGGGGGTYTSGSGNGGAGGGGGSGGNGSNNGTGGTGGLNPGVAGTSTGGGAAGANTGGGGGANWSYTGGYTSGAGGSGIMYISYAWPTQRGSGGTVTNYSANGQTWWVHTFTGTGTFTA